MSPAAKGTSKQGRAGRGILRLQAPVRKTSKKRPSGQELRDALVALHAWEAVSGPHVTGLGQMQMWVTAYSTGVLATDEDPDSGPHGRIVQ